MGNARSEPNHFRLSAVAAVEIREETSFISVQPRRLETFEPVLPGRPECTGKCETFRRVNHRRGSSEPRVWKNKVNDSTHQFAMGPLAPDSYGLAELKSRVQTAQLRASTP